jgi:hypothetical protein
MTNTSTGKPETVSTEAARLPVSAPVAADTAKASVAFMQQTVPKV